MDFLRVDVRTERAYGDLASSAVYLDQCRETDRWTVMNLDCNDSLGVVGHQSIGLAHIVPPAHRQSELQAACNREPTPAVLAWQVHCPEISPGSTPLDPRVKGIHLVLITLADKIEHKLDISKQPG